MDNTSPKDVPIVIFTVRCGDDSIKKSMEFADAYINKPFRVEEFFRIVVDYAIAVNPEN